eukprot:scaffold13.g193.t1
MLLGARCVLGVSPAPIRGACTIAYSICVQAGLLVAQGLNQGLKDWEHGWQLSLGLAGVPAVLIMAALPFMPETPNSLVERGRLEAGLRMLVLLRGVPVDKVRAELDDIKEAAVRTRAVGNTWLNLTRRKFRPQLVGAIGLPIANQFTGIMAVTGWSPSLFMSMGASGSFPFVAAMIISGISLLAACVADVLVDRMGRRKLFTIGGIVMGITQLVEGGLIAVNVPPSGEITQSTSLVHSLLAISCVFQAGFGVSWAPLGWLVPVEIQHLETRSSGYAVSIAVNYGFAFLVVECFQSMLCGMQYGVFIFYGLLNFINIALILTFLPETARVPIEELHSLFRNHWYWRRMAPSEAEEEVEAASSAAAGKLEVTGQSMTAPGTVLKGASCTLALVGTYMDTMQNVAVTNASVFSRFWGVGQLASLLAQTFHPEVVIIKTLLLLVREAPGPGAVAALAGGAGAGPVAKAPALGGEGGSSSPTNTAS